MSAQSESRERFSREYFFVESTTLKSTMKLEEFCLIFLVICGGHSQRQGEVQRCGIKPNLDGISSRIFGGDEVESNAWPWLVAFVFRPIDKFSCAGSLVSSKYVISGEIQRLFTFLRVQIRLNFFFDLLLSRSLFQKQMAS